MFSIKDNVIVGNEPARGLETDSIAKIILDAFDNDPDFVFQVIRRRSELVFRIRNSRFK